MEAQQSAGELYLPQGIEQVRLKGDQAVVLVLSGGGALAPIHIGVWGAFLENGIPVDLVVGTSAGSIGAMVVSRVHNLSQWLMAKDWGETIGWKDISRSAILPQGGLFSFEPLKDYINDRLKWVKNNDPDYSPLPTVLVATETTPGRKGNLFLVWQPPPDGTLGRVIWASCAVPLAIEPCWIDGRRLCDGGAVFGGNEPVGVARFLAPDALVISVRLYDFWPLNSPVEPDFRIEPCRDVRNHLYDQAFFDPADVQRGYLAGLENIEAIEALMAARGISPVVYQGFTETGGLD